MAGSAAVAPRAAPRNRRRLSWLGSWFSTSAMTSSCAGIGGMEGIRELAGTIRERDSGVNVTWRFGLALTAHGGLPRLPRMARIAIDLGRRIGSVDRRIFGNFIEHPPPRLLRGVFGQLHRAPRPLHLRRDLRGKLAAQRRPRLSTGCAGRGAPAPDPRAPVAGRELRERIPLDRRRRANGGPAPA